MTNNPTPVPLPTQPNQTNGILSLPNQIQDENNITFTDIGNASEYIEKSKKIRKGTDGTLISINEIGEAEVYKHKIIEKKLTNTNQNQPLWAQSLQNSINNLQTSVTTLQNDLTTLQTSVTTLQTSVTTLQTSVNSTDQRTLSRILNSYVVNDNDILHGLFDNNGAIPNNFPQTLNDLKTMDTNTIQPILRAYGITPLFNTIKSKRTALALYIGCRATMP